MADPAKLQQIVQLLLTAASGAGNHREALQQIEGLRSDPTFFQYCAHLLGSEGNADPNFQRARQLAGYQLKNNIQQPACHGDPTVQAATMAALGSPTPGIRNAAVAVLGNALFHTMWDISLVDQLAANLTAGASPDLVLGSSKALAGITEQLIEPLDAAGKTATIAPAALQMLGHSEARCRSDALLMMSVLLEQAGISPNSHCFAALAPGIGSILPPLGVIFQNQKSLGGEEVALAIKCLYLTFTFQDSIAPHFEQMITMATSNATHADPRVRIEVLEFWRAVLHFPVLASRAFSHMPAVLNYVLTSMVYSAEEVEELQANQNDWNVPDKEESIKPKHFQRDYGADEGDNDEDEVDQYTPRTVAAMVLDELGQFYADKILESVLQVVGTRLDPAQPWQVQESAILALGSISEGCIVGLMPHLPQIIPRVLQTLESDSTHFLVQCISCWCLQSFASWILESDEAQQQQLLPRTMAAVVVRMQAPSKKLQEYATAAMSTIASECCNHEMDDVAQPVIEAIAKCLPAYQLKNRYLLFEATDAVCEALGRRLADETTFNTLMGPLGQLWVNTAPHSPLVFPLYRCMGTVCQAAGEAVQPYANDLITKAFQQMSAHTQGRAQAHATGAEYQEDSDQFLIAGLDLFGSLCETLGGSMAPYIQAIGADAVIGTLGQSASDESKEVRQSVFGVIGELCGSCPTLIQANLTGVATAMLNSMRDISEYYVCSNAAWALGELIENQALDQGVPVLEAPHYDGFYTALFGLLVGEHDVDMRGMADNVSLTLGQLLRADPQVLQRNANLPLTGCLGRWCSYMRNIKSPVLKERAMRGMVPQLAAQPQAAITQLHLVLEVFASLPSETPLDLVQQSQACMQTLSQSPQWAQGLASFDPKLRKQLQVLYGV